LALVQKQGFAITDPLLSAEECETVIAHLEHIPGKAAGTRNLLMLPWCTALAHRIVSHPFVTPLFKTDYAPVQCTLFEKTPQRNWLVTTHQDLSIPVAARIKDPAVSGWSRKEGTLYAQPPASVLSETLAVRLQLDESGPEDGSLRVVGGSHLHGRLEDAQALALRDQFGETTCPVPRGGALLMRPLLLHSSSKLRTDHPRRVLHFLFGPRELPFGLEWAHVS
jgi:ectoine hydroxylase-related dioxygenase (phytanoyl-CoA dioxygenase family)